MFKMTVASTMKELVGSYKYRPDLRPADVKLTENNTLCAKDVDLLNGMICVADRVVPVDLKKEF